MKIVQRHLNTDLCERLRDLRPGTVFECVGGQPKALPKALYGRPKALYLVLQWETTEGYRGLYPIADLTNNLYLPAGYFDPDTAVRRKLAEVHVKPENAF